MILTFKVNYTNDRRQTPRNRFGWVRRLMQGQNRATIHPSPPSTGVPNTRSVTSDSSSSSQVPDITTRTTRLANSRHIRNSEDSQNQSVKSTDESDSLQNGGDGDENSLDAISDMHSDNVSTTPLKSIISTQSTKEPSILSGDANIDLTSLNASTAETSLAPSVNTPTNYTFTPTITNGSALATPTSNGSNNNHNQTLNLNNSGVPDRDSESIVTLASSTRRIRRRSIDTNCSTAGIPPASIMERLSVQPANSNYATSIRTANDRASQVEAASHYDDQSSSVRSFN